MDQEYRTGIARFSCHLSTLSVVDGSTRLVAAREGTQWYSTQRNRETV